mmetsp:Transcript_104406/g.225283  ORF Transcript_104406/g.225283 Transcript_104406/m.225283 type:complete len:428 (-) Transcript_104406:16-1299(-)
MQHVVRLQGAHQPQALDFLAGQREVHVVAPGRVAELLGEAASLLLELLVLAPPDLGRGVEQPVDLLHVGRDVELIENLGKARDHARAHEPDGVDELQAQGLRQGEVLAEELAHLREAHHVVGEERAEFHGEVPHRARGYQEGQPLPGLAVEDLDAQLLQRLRVAQVLQDRGPRHEEGLEAEARRDLDVLADLAVRAELPGLVEPVAVPVRPARGDGLPQPDVAAEVRGGESSDVPVGEIRALLHEVHRDGATAHEEGHVQSRPARDVGGVQRQLAVDKLLHHRQGPAPAGRVQRRCAVGVARVGVRAEDEQPPYGRQVGRGGEDQHQPVHLVEVLQRLVEDGSRGVAGAGVIEQLVVVAGGVQGCLWAHAPAAEGSVPHGAESGRTSASTLEAPPSAGLELAMARVGDSHATGPARPASAAGAGGGT